MNIDGADWLIRDYRPADEGAWLRCRVLGFLDTSYYDDVLVSKPRHAPGVGLVATAGDDIVGLCDASIDEASATIETIVVHPDFRRRGIAHALVQHTCERLQRAAATTVDAWTREDPGTLAWYQAEGFSAVFRYLHVYASTPQEMERATTPRPGLMPRNGHFHAWESEEAILRERFDRVYGCNRFMKAI
ncbi:MAG: GNAT family N-acetyltransferase [Brachybacterium sp.]|nr:GNAT family N-acetyltransferase [Brachybacterium sp.]